MSRLENYKHLRKALIAEERALRFDSEAILNATPREIQASDKVHKIRAREAKEIWSFSAEKLMYPGMEFLTAKETIVKTKLYEIVKKMPKGALLHGHMDAMYDASFIYKLALEHPNMHIRVPTTINADLPLPIPNFNALSPDLTALYASEPSLTSSDYKPGSWSLLSKARQEFTLGGSKGFDEWIVDSMMIRPKEAYTEFNTSAKIWKKFQSTFSVVEVE